MPGAGVHAHLVLARSWLAEAPTPLAVRDPASDGFLLGIHNLHLSILGRGVVVIEDFDLDLPEPPRAIQADGVREGAGREATRKEHAKEKGSREAAHVWET